MEKANRISRLPPTSHALAAHNSRRPTALNVVHPIEEDHGEESVMSGKKKLNHENRRQLLKMALVIFVLIVSLITITAASLDASRVTWRTTETAFSAVHAAIKVGAVVVKVQIECGFSTLYLDSQKGEITRYKIADARADVDDLLSTLMESWDYFPILKETFPTPNHLKMLLDTHRALLMESKVTVTAVQNIVFYNNIHDMLLNSIVHEVRLPSSRSLWKSLVALDSLYRAGGAAGVQMTLGGVYFTQCWLPASEKLWFIQLESQLRTFLSQGTQYHPSVRLLKKRSLNDINPLVKALDLRKDEIMDLGDTGLLFCENNTRGWAVDRSLKWFDNMTIYLEVLGNMRAQLEVDALGQLKAISVGARNKLAIYSSIMAAVTVMCLLLGLWYSLRLVIMTSEIRLYATRMSLKTRLLQEEQIKMDVLLKRILPRTVATLLGQNKAVEAEYYHSVTVCFSTIIGFSALAEQFSAAQTINLMNCIYSLIDEVVAKYNVYKVETIRDKHMVASGVPERNGVEHVREVTLMALDLLDSMAAFSVRRENVEKTTLRIGIHSGSVVAGVIGDKMPHYCLLGDAVNQAVEMEATGKANKIHISSSAKHLLDSVGFFEFEKHGELEIKGKADQKTYWVTPCKGTHGDRTALESLDVPTDGGDDELVEW